MPNILRIFGLAVNFPDSELARHIVLQSTISGWSQHFHIDLSSMANLTPDPGAMRFWFRPQKMDDWQRLSDPILLAEIDFGDQEPVQIDHIKKASANQDGILNGIVGFFEIQLGPKISWSTNPTSVDDNNYWYCPVWTPQCSFKVNKGDIFSLHL